MKCGHCGGRLEGNLTVCPFCSTRQDVDLAQANEQEKAAKLRSLHLPPMGSDMGRSRTGGIDWSKLDADRNEDYLSGGEAVIDVIKGMLSSFFR